MKISLPVEVKSRDLTGTVWLALNFLEDGHEVAVGETSALRNGVDVIKPDVYLQPGLSRGDEKVKLCRQLKQAGVKILVLETEGGVFTDDNYFKSNLVHEEMFGLIDLYLSWGKRQEKMLNEELSTSSSKTHVSGHPRFDLLQEDLREIYRDQSNTYCSEYGDYILINTNFTSINRAAETSTGSSSDRIRYEADILQEYTKSIKKLALDFESHSIIVRPHPMEDISYYCNEFNDLNNIYAIREGNVRPWILGADVVIHKSSTSGIESALLDRPVISYRPSKSSEFDAHLPILVSDERTSYSSLQQAVANYIKSETYSLNRKQIEGLRDYFHNIGDFRAADYIARCTKSLSSEQETSFNHINPPLKQRLKRIGVRYMGIDITEKIGEAVLGSDFSNTRQKVPKITKQEIKKKIRSIKQHTDIEVDKTKIEKVSELPNTFVIAQINDK